MAEEKIAFKSQNQYQKWLSQIIKIPNSNQQLKVELTRLIGKEQTEGFTTFNQVILREKLYTKGEMLVELRNPNFRKIIDSKIKLYFSKKWKKRIRKEMKKIDKSVKR